MSPAPVPAAVEQALERAEVIVAAEAVQFAIDQMAVRLTTELADQNPLLLCVLQGGLPYSAELARRFQFPMQLDCVHVGRYRGATRGSELEWLAKPQLDLAGRHVLLIDDVLDQGVTLTELAAWAEQQGADRVMTTVLVDKDVARPEGIVVDFPALRCPDRYLIGCGMDYRGYWRNLPAIYALPRDLEDAP